LDGGFALIGEEPLDQHGLGDGAKPAIRGPSQKCTLGTATPVWPANRFGLRRMQKVKKRTCEWSLPKLVRITAMAQQPKSSLKWCAVMLVTFCLSANCLSSAQLSSSKDCVPILKARDYYQYASKNSLQEDYLKSIDEETYQQMQKDNNLTTNALTEYGDFSLNDDYHTFDEKRNKYLENLHYDRTEQQALDILQITVNPRAYDDYAKCLDGLGGGAGAPLRVYPVNEDMDRIEVRVKYVNPSGVKSKVLVGQVFGGAVDGAPVGHLWKDGSKWGIMQTRAFFIKRERGMPETVISVQTADGSAEPVTLRFKRADATIALEFVGTEDVLRTKDRHASVITPNNDYNRGSCPNQVGRGHEGECISRTTVSMSTKPPYYFQNPRTDCWPTGGSNGCPWTTRGHASVSGDGLTATTTLDNGSVPVDLVVIADEWEHLSASQCKNDGPIPVVKGQAVLFTSPKECGEIAQIHWKHLPDNSERAFKFGSEDKRVIMDGKAAETDKTLRLAYKLASD
jgi:hypothetical protein